jgi:hypothetical protein
MLTDVVDPYAYVSNESSESAQIEDAFRAGARMSSDQLRSSIEALLAQPPEISWVAKPTEIALFGLLFERTRFVDDRIVGRFLYTLKDVGYLFEILKTIGFQIQDDMSKPKTLLSGEPSVFFLSTKFGDYVSSQEYFSDVLQLVARSMKVVLLSEREFSVRYKHRFQCINFTGALELESFLSGFPGGLVVDLSGGHSEMFSGLSQKFRVVDPHGAPRLSTAYLHSQLATASFVKYRRLLVNPVDSLSDPLMFAPAESAFRSYPEIDRSDRVSRNIIFGAFCRTAKLNLPVVREWAKLLRRYRSAELWFAFIQSNTVSEVFVKRVFERLGVSPDRVRFVPRLDTRSYLELMNRVTINLGAMPEQGGISCMDSLMMGCPYVVCRELSNTLLSSLSLQELGLHSWDASSIQEFHDVIDRLVNDSRRLSDPDTRRSIRGRLMSSGLASGDRTAREWVRFFGKVYGSAERDSQNAASNT